MSDLYARLEETNDEILRKYSPNALKRAKNKDAVFYRDPEFREFVARIPWYHSNRPTSRTRVMLNCSWHSVTWMTAKTHYATVRDALIANRYGLEDARRIALRLCKRKGDPIDHLNAYLSERKA